MSDEEKIKEAIRLLKETDSNLASILIANYNENTTLKAEVSRLKKYKVTATEVLDGYIKLDIKQKAQLQTAKEGLRALLNKVNRVTCSHRHGQKVTKEDLDSLSNRQIEVEETLKKIGESDVPKEI